MSIKKIKDFDQIPSSGISSDDILLIMDNPSNNGITKKIDINTLSQKIDSFANNVIYYSGVFPSTIHNLDHQDAKFIIFDLTNNTNIPNSGYLSITGMKAGYDGQKITLMNFTGYKTNINPAIQYKNIFLFNSVLGSGSLPENRFSATQLTENGRYGAYNSKAVILDGGTNQGSSVECIYISYLSKWYIMNNVSVNQILLGPTSVGSVGGGGI